MKPEPQHPNKPRRRTSRYGIPRRRLERLLKDVLAGKRSIHAIAELMDDSAKRSQRRVVE